jgi:rare lipoprotein A
MTIKTPLLLLSLMLLSACADFSLNSPIAGSAPIKNEKASSVDNAGGKPGAGAYYLDDGPGDNAPANLDSIPSAILKVEQPLPRANKPYVALGQPYTPMTAYQAYKKQGVASWYGKRYHGKKTSTGEIYDMYGMTAAHTTLPIPSYAKVTNPANGRSVIVRINDRGPFKRDRLIDLSYVAAYQLRLVNHGSGLVEVEAIDTSVAAMQTAAAPVSAVSRPEQNEAEGVLIQAVPNEAVTSPSAKLDAPVAPGVYLQLGAFKNEANSQILQKKIQESGLVENAAAAKVYNDGLYRVRLGPYASKVEAENMAAKIRQQLNMTAVIIY